MVQILFALCVISLSVAPREAAAQGTVVDLELVLAVDTSGSIDAEEFVLQMRGIAAAFRDPLVQAAIVGGGAGRIAVALMLWADASLPKDTSTWFLLDSAESANAFADAVERFPRGVGGGTGIGDGIAHALDMIRRNGIRSRRQVVDVSGDGKETPPRYDQSILLPQARDMAEIRGVTVNGLAILTDVPELFVWYRHNVIAGPGNFVMQAENFHAFRHAFREKLLRELLPRVAAAPPPAAGTRSTAF